MIVLAAIPFVILSRYAGDWGVPYFSFQTERGSTCTNDIAGYHCDDVTVEDIRWWGDISLPSSTTVLSSHYRATHDFTLDAVVAVPKQDRPKTSAAINRTFGTCQSGHPTQLDTTGLSGVCTRANDATLSSSSSKFSDTLYEVTTGIRKDGTMVVGIHEESR
ncbi:hypothetical protein SAMN04489812_5153 [Microlunatus soli]|uniref:Uncharacterized protein n=2 Tax=Microlunatus soli TaxID=630515 RepID=A0A1H1ZDR6_9ACTN|nr:hypothetical protein SAMN04489812_5153 [Microlunatus soli]